MRRAWLVLMLGCGFQSNTTVDAGAGDVVDAPDVDAAIDAPEEPLSNCATLVFDRVAISVCPEALGAPIVITGNTTFDTDSKVSIPAGLTCSDLERDDVNDRNSEDVCAVAASSITVNAGATLLARGKKPLVFVAKSIQIDGAVDVASRTGGDRAGVGAGFDAAVCNSFTRAINNGGGQGGTFSNTAGGAGGNGGDNNDIGGPPMSSIGIGRLRGGCPGGPSGNNNGGVGGGAVWLAAIGSAGSLGLGSNATVNASGAGGSGGTALPNRRGGSGGGSGGLIVLQGATVSLTPTTKVFAVGGGGGGAASMFGTGGAGNEAAAPAQGGTGGTGGSAPVAGTPGLGGVGFPAAAEARIGGTGTGATNGGGGGGGGAGTIWIDARNTVGTALVSPPAEIVPH